jgi:hypothetical protein
MPKEEFVVRGVSSDHASGKSGGGTNYYLRGEAGGETYEFAVSSSIYENHAHPASLGRKLVVWRNRDMPSLAVQTKSVHVILDEDWRPLDTIRISAISTLCIALVALLVSALSFITARRLAAR